MSTNTIQTIFLLYFISDFFWIDTQMSALLAVSFFFKLALLYQHLEFLFHGHILGSENLCLMQVSTLGFDE